MSESKTLEQTQKEIEEKKKSINEQLMEHQAEIRRLYSQRQEEEMKEKALENFQKNAPASNQLSPSFKAKQEEI